MPHIKLSLSLKSLFFFVLGILTLLVMAKVELPLLFGQDENWERKIEAYRWILHIHAFAGSMALFIAPLQFLFDLRSMHPRLHRKLGRIYAASICIAAPLAFWIAIMSMSSAEKWTACAQASLWLYATIAAVVTAIHSQFDRHRIWILRSYALTCTFVLTRFFVDVLGMHFSQSLGGNAGLTVSSSILVWICADLIAVRKHTMVWEG